MSKRTSVKGVLPVQTPKTMGNRNLTRVRKLMDKSSTPEGDSPMRKNTKSSLPSVPNDSQLPALASTSAAFSAFESVSDSVEVSGQAHEEGNATNSPKLAQAAVLQGAENSSKTGNSITDDASKASIQSSSLSFYTPKAIGARSITRKKRMLLVDNALIPENDGPKRKSAKSSAVINDSKEVLPQVAINSAAHNSKSQVDVSEPSFEEFDENALSSSNFAPAALSKKSDSFYFKRLSTKSNESSNDDKSSESKHDFTVSAIFDSKPSDEGGTLYLVQWGVGVYEPSWVQEDNLAGASVLIKLYRNHMKSFQKWSASTIRTLEENFESTLKYLEKVGELPFRRKLEKIFWKIGQVEEENALKVLFHCNKLVNAKVQMKKCKKKEAKEWQEGTDSKYGVDDYRRLIKWALQQLE